MGNIPRSYVGGRYFLNLDGEKSGYLKSVEGGGIKAEVLFESGGPEATPKKHLGPTRVEPVELEVDFVMGKGLWEWIAASWSGKPARKSGSIVETDLNLQARSERRFENALITETTIPALDAAAKEHAFLKLRLQPEQVSHTKGDGTKLAPPQKPPQKAFLPSNFRLELAGLDCSKVSRIDAFTVTQKLSRDAVGERREVEREPASLEIPNLRVTLAESAAQTWLDWFEDFVVKGNCADDREKSGTIAFLSPNRQEELGRVTLQNVGIFSLSEPRADSGAETVARLVADLYVEQMALRVGAKPPVRTPIRR